MPVQITLNKARVPVKVFTQDIEHDAIQQLLNVLCHASSQARRMRTRSISVLLLACVLAAIAPFAAPTPAPVVSTGFPGWPTTFEGQPLRPLELTQIEQRFAVSFPGHIGRFSDGQREVIVRWIAAPTRKLHPALDCFKGSGYRVTPLPLETRAGETWGAFAAEHGEQRLHVREAIADASGKRWTDVSAWYWAAMRGDSQGPWWAITVATAASAQQRVSVPLANAE